MNNPVKTNPRLTTPKGMAAAKAGPIPRSAAAEELNRPIAQKASNKIPIAINAQPSPMKRAEKNESAGNREFFMVGHSGGIICHPAIQNDSGVITLVAADSEAVLGIQSQSAVSRRARTIRK